MNTVKGNIKTFAHPILYKRKKWDFFTLTNDLNTLLFKSVQKFIQQTCRFNN